MQEKQYNVGRGNRKASRANLKPQVKDHFVMERVEGMAWSVFSGPTTRAAAYRQAESLNSHYYTGKPFTAASRSVAMEHDALGVAEHEYQAAQAKADMEDTQ